ncbi:predicted protein [Plenodomus lingam JN3]|uniref:Predicted protein n=1 Tax=Leptosphaeria maculans (strain JN3 / isolate v23.1.3 / race Av1-4-5-6-7-8) TaxID=985895 RepID=E4ZN59_LEPMJ|nr:predicted protein [Plenodomus lingam JN3]CBX92662.1 predicted protein [Plenodomus lingam JN3]
MNTPLHSKHLRFSLVLVPLPVRRCPLSGTGRAGRCARERADRCFRAGMGGFLLLFGFFFLA